MAKTTTNSSRVGDSSLSLRLHSLHNHYHNETSIWDIGCDHGLLGLSFMNNEQVQRVNLVDPAAPVIETLRDKIKATYISNPKLFIHHQPGQAVKLDPSSNCIFIAGMGGKEIGEIIQHLMPQLTSNDRLVISPHRKIIELRELLHSMQLELLDEEVLKEDGQYYQIMVLAKSEKSGLIPLYGEKLWSSETGKEYRIHQLKHFDLHQDVASRQYISFLKSLNS